MQAYSVDSLNNLRVTYGVVSRPDSQGNTQPASVDGDIKYDLLEGDVQIQVTPGTGGKEVLFITGAPNTLNRIRQYADADLGEGVRTIEDEIVLTVLQPEAEGFFKVNATLEPK